MKILITGTAGFIGSHLARKLIEKGHSIVGVDNINDYYDPQLKEDRLKTIDENHHTFYKLNLEDYDELTDVFRKEQPDIVINLAAQAGVRYSLENPRAYIDSNVVGFMNILVCCSHFDVMYLIYASYRSVYCVNTSYQFLISDNVHHLLR